MDSSHGDFNTDTNRELTFEEEWQQNQAQIFRLCQICANNPGDAEDIFQLTALRAWRGYRSFQRRSSFLTWVISIVRNESNRFLAKGNRLQKREIACEEIEKINLPESATYVIADDSILTNHEKFNIQDLLVEVTHAGVLTPDELQVIIARNMLSCIVQNDDRGMDDPVYYNRTCVDWDEVSKKIGRPAATCSVQHFRAIQKLRVYLFLHRMEYLGGREAVENAFQMAQHDSSQPLSSREIMIFRSFVLEQKMVCSSGWRTDLRASCNKVIKYLELP